MFSTVAANTEAAARAAAERGGAAATASLRAALDRHAEALAVAAATPQAPPMHQLTAALRDATHRYVQAFIQIKFFRQQKES